VAAPADTARLLELARYTRAVLQAYLEGESEDLAGLLEWIEQVTRELAAGGREGARFDIRAGQAQTPRAKVRLERDAAVPAKGCDMDAAIPAKGGLVSRMVRAARLDSSVYQEVDAATDATGQAAAVVALGAVAAGVWTAVPQVGGGTISTLAALAIGIGVELLSWLVWTLAVYLVGRVPAEGRVSFGGVARAMGFASTPSVLLVFAFVPVLAALVVLLVFVWRILTGVVAVRVSLGLGTGMAVVTMLIATLLQALVFCLLGPFLLVLFAFTSGAFFY
jgi:hypothetical protein